MKQILRIAKTELQILFYSPIAWFVLIIFAFQAANIYAGFITPWSENMALGGVLYNITENLFAGFRGVFIQMDRQLFYYIPLLTMGLISRELSSGSIKLLYSSPISNTQIILGKFLALVVYALLMTGFLGCMYIHSFIFVENFDWAFPLVALLGLFLSICIYGAVGIFMSSLTSYQMVAALSTLVILTVLSQVGNWWQSISFVRDITYWLSIRGRSGTFLRGMLCSEDLLYFIVVTALFLVLAIFRLNSKREKIKRSTTLMRYGILFVVVIGISYVSSRPSMKMYWDATHFDRNTIPQGSLDVMNKLKPQGRMTITTYNNIFDQERLSLAVSPAGEVFDMKSFEQYIRFKSDISMKYVYYYSTKGEDYDNQRKRYPKKTEEEVIEQITKRLNIKRRRLLTEEEVLKLEPELATENFRLTKVVTMEDGRKGFIRYFNDIIARPLDREISAAFKRIIVDKFPKVAFLEGTGRVITQKGEMNYSNFTDKLIRTSLYNQGFDVTRADLKTPIEDDVNILVIADMNFEMTPEQKANYQSYIDRGGNLFILGEPVNHKYTNAIIEPFGVKALQGRIVQSADGFKPDLIFARPTEASEATSYIFDVLRQRQYLKVGMPSVSQLAYEENKGYNVQPLFVTAPDRQVWNEVETTNFEEEKPHPNPAKGEIVDTTLPTMVVLRRPMGDREQKILISGDADCISNVELSNRAHTSESLANSEIVLGAFNFLSDGISPIDTRRPEPIDKILNLKSKGGRWTRLGFVWIMPGLMLLTALLINIRRRSR